MLFFHYIQTALFTAMAAFAAPEAPAEDIEALASESEDQGLEDGELTPRGPWYICSASGTFGRQEARIRVSPNDPDICQRQMLGSPDPGRISCYKMRSLLGCSQIVDY